MGWQAMRLTPAPLAGAARLVDLILENRGKTDLKHCQDTLKDIIGLIDGHSSKDLAAPAAPTLKDFEEEVFRRRKVGSVLRRALRNQCLCPGTLYPTRRCLVQPAC